MKKYFRCLHCGILTLQNPRLKTSQLYCGKKTCQQARKNNWEKEKLQKDKSYRSLRNSQKAKWRNLKPCDQYQKEYRDSHPEYVQINREKQRARNKKQIRPSPLPDNKKIVKTDALLRDIEFPQGLFVLESYNCDTMKKIVKTDALIVRLQPYCNNRDPNGANTG